MSEYYIMLSSYFISVILLVCFINLEISWCFVFKHTRKIPSNLISLSDSSDVTIISRTSSQPESANENFRKALRNMFSTFGSLATLSAFSLVGPAVADEAIKKTKKLKVLEVSSYCTCL